MLLAKSVAVASGRGCMIRRAVALNGENRLPRLRRMHRDKIDAVSRRAKLRDERQSVLHERVVYRLLEIVQCHRRRDATVDSSAT
jgi:hypothetical protein